MSIDSPARRELAHAQATRRIERVAASLRELLDTKLTAYLGQIKGKR